MPKLSNVRIFDGTAFRPETALCFHDGLVTALDNSRDGEDMGGFILCPGFVDIHMHGQMGFDSMRPGDAAHMAETSVAFGVTAFCPTSVTATDEAIRDYLAGVHSAMALDRGARVLGAHVEGPYLAASVRGAHDEAQLKAPEIAHYRALVSGYGSDVVRVTLAPELPGGMELVRYLAAHGVLPSIGHSAATAEEAARAIRLGVRCATHTCNGMEPLHHRRPGVLGVVLTDDAVCAELIADLIHIDPLMIRLIYRAKGEAGCFYCTDSMEAAGMPDGDYHLGQDAVTVKNGVALKNAGLAGSTLTMDQGLRNLVRDAAIPLSAALRMGTRNPADAIGRRDIGRLTAGAKADFILLDDALNVCATYVRGRCEYTRTR